MTRCDREEEEKNLREHQLPQKNIDRRTMAGETINAQTLATVEATNGYFYPVTIPDHDVPFPLVDLIYKARDDVETISRWEN